MKVLGAVWQAWKRFGVFIGDVVSGIILTVFYFSFFGIAAIVFRIFSANVLTRHSKDSNWVARQAHFFLMEDFESE